MVIYQQTNRYTVLLYNINFNSLPIYINFAASIYALIFLFAAITGSPVSEVPETKAKDVNKSPPASGQESNKEITSKSFQMDTTDL